MLIDLHMHSVFSADSQQLVEDYFKHSEAQVIVTTEHLDFMQNLERPDMILDYGGLKTEMMRCSAVYQKTALIGIEIGYTIESEQRIKDYLEEKVFDFKILSVHQDEQSDYLHKEAGYQVDCDYYLETIIAGLKAVEGIDSLGHLDYPFRKNSLDPSFIDNPKLLQVFELLVAKNIALEVNTRSLFQYRNVGLYQQLLSRYKQAGGKLISLASDAHSIDYYQYHFEQSVQLINQSGEFELINYRYH